jgi:hypothetical protein
MAWRCYRGATLQTFFLWYEISKGKCLGSLVIWYCTQCSVLSCRQDVYKNRIEYERAGTPVTCALRQLSILCAALCKMLTRITLSHLKWLWLCFFWLMEHSWITFWMLCGSILSIAGWIWVQNGGHSLPVPRSFLIGCHKCWQMYTKEQGRQSLLLFWTDVIQDMKGSCWKLMWGMKPGTTILNLNTSDIWGNGTTWHPQGRRNLECAI